MVVKVSMGRPKTFTNSAMNWGNFRGPAMAWYATAAIKNLMLDGAAPHGTGMLRATKRKEWCSSLRSDRPGENGLIPARPESMIEVQKCI